MESFLDRLKQEKQELHEKVVKLSDFLNSENVKVLSEANQILLKQQLVCMNDYLNILIVRIELIEK